MSPLFHPLEAYVQAREAELARIAEERLASLEALTTAIAADPGGTATFVCTHNSRRSHLAQVWASVAARHAGLTAFRACSAGTEATAVAPGVVAALARAGLRLSVEGPDGAPNPVVRAELGDRAPALALFSKTLSHPSLPKSGFVAVLTCASADAACPNVPGASARVALPYRDPKEADGRPDADAVYDERCAEIAREMLFVFGSAADALAL